jgi:hypothetical protein
MTRLITSPAEPTLQNSDNQAVKLVRWNKLCDVALHNFGTVHERLRNMKINVSDDTVNRCQKLKEAAFREIAKRSGDGNIPPVKDE